MATNRPADLDAAVDAVVSFWDGRVEEALARLKQLFHTFAVAGPANADAAGAAGAADASADTNAGAASAGPPTLTADGFGRLLDECGLGDGGGSEDTSALWARVLSMASAKQAGAIADPELFAIAAFRCGVVPGAG